MLGLIAVDVHTSEIPLHDILQGAARRFAPHVTIMPRFHFGNLSLLRARVTEIEVPGAIELRGPRMPSDSLVWYECDSDCIGYVTLKGAHATCMRLTSYQHGLFNGPNYRPHLTIASNAVRAMKDFPDRIEVLPQALVLYIYGAAPDEGPVERLSLRTI